MPYTIAIVNAIERSLVRVSASDREIERLSEQSSDRATERPGDRATEDDHASSSRRPFETLTSSTAFFKTMSSSILLMLKSKQIKVFYYVENVQ